MLVTGVSRVAGLGEDEPAARSAAGRPRLHGSCDFLRHLAARRRRPGVLRGAQGGLCRPCLVGRAIVVSVSWAADKHILTNTTRNYKKL